jgi:hypothetical protein
MTAQEPGPPNNEGADFVRQIVQDPKNAPDVMLLYGFARDSSEDGMSGFISRRI